MKQPGNAGKKRGSEAALEKRLPLLVAIVGPTGAGKSALALALAEGRRGEILNCDSIALYREVEIGAAKPTEEERRRVPHHLFDVLAPSEPATAGDYARRARAVLEEMKARGVLPIVAGGSGLYLRALLEGLFPGPPRSPQLRQRLRRAAARRRPGYLHRMLARLDAAAARGIHPHDEPKLIRGIEVCLAARARMSELWQRGRDPLTGFRILRLGLLPERNALYARINQRARLMFERGLVEEAGALCEKYGEAALPLAAPGYRQAMQFLRGEGDRKLALWAAQQAHRNYAKRQMTWFRREPEVRWLNGFGDDPAIQQQAAEMVEAESQGAARGRGRRRLART